MNLRKNFMTGAVLAGILSLVPQVQAVTAYGVTGTGSNTQTLVRFDTDTPGTILSSVTITGLFAGDSVVGIDYRSTDGKLYALGAQSRIYTIAYASGIASQIGTAAFTPPLNGTSFGFDFNPVPNVLRIVSNTGQSLRVSPTSGTLLGVDGSLFYVPGDANAATSPSVVAAAYTRSMPGATSTTLYGLDSNLNVLTRIGGLDGPPSPNTGGMTTVGPLGIDIDLLAGFDVTPGPETSTALAVFSLPGGASSALYTINLNNGSASLKGQIPVPGQISSFAVVSDIDNDGVADPLDLCSNTAPGVQVDDNGCPLAVPAVGADLTGFWVAASEQCGKNPTKLNCKIKGTVVVANIGQADAAKTTVRFYLSGDGNFDAGDTLLASKNINLKSGKFKGVKFRAKTGTPQLLGKFLIAVIDGDALVVETDETNNVLVRGPN